MTTYNNDTQGDYSAIARIALRCMRVYRDLLRRGLYDNYDVRNVGNAILFVDDEIKRREAVARTATLTVTSDNPNTISG